MQQSHAVLIKRNLGCIEVITVLSYARAGTVVPRETMRQALHNMHRQVTLTTDCITIALHCVANCITLSAAITTSSPKNVTQIRRRPLPFSLMCSQLGRSTGNAILTYLVVNLYSLLHHSTILLA